MPHTLNTITLGSTHLSSLLWRSQAAVNPHCWHPCHFSIVNTCSTEISFFFFKFSRSSEIKTRQHWFSMFFSWIAIMITMQRNSYLWEEFNKIHLKHILKLSFCFFETMLIRFSNASILGLSWEVKISMLNIPLYFVANLFNVCN